MNIINYIVVEGTSSARLTDYVKDFIKNGWQPQGGMSVHTNGAFYQPMVKYEETKPPRRQAAG